MRESERRLVLWVGPAPTVARQFRSRALQIDPTPLKNTPAGREQQWGWCCGLVIAYRIRPEFKQICENAITLIPEALRHGVQVQILVESNEFPHLDQLLQALAIKPGNGVFVTTAALDLDDLAERFSKHDCGPSIRSGKPTFSYACTEDARFLLRRAFEDCDELQCHPIPHPSGTAAVFHVHALLQKSPAGRRLQPFFVKIAGRQIIDREIDNYETYVDGFVPFHLRPNLVRSRSFSNATDGIIVGNFADHCETFASAARRGIGPSIVHALFAETLRGWRVQAHDRDQKRPSLAQSLGAFKPSAFPQARVDRAKAFGASNEPSELVARFAAAGSIEHLVSIAHMDLHVGNVMVRNRDAIVIDFGSVTTGPLVADPALLEASLLCMLDQPETSDDFDAWKRLALDLVEPKNLRSPPPHVFAPNPREWLWETVRALRLVGLAAQTSDSEYALALAHYLMIQSMITMNAAEDERRAFAYVLAERILDNVAPR